VLAAIGLTYADLHQDDQPGQNPRQIVATYDYADENGRALYHVHRYATTGFSQQRVDGSWKLGDVRRVLYRLQQIQQKKTVFACEGEKDAHALESIGLPATTNAGGASKWREDYTQQLMAAGVENVIILPDNDDPGRQHALDVARSVTRAGLAAKIVSLPGLREKEDVSDYLAAGHTKDDLLALVKATVVYAEKAESAAIDLAFTDLDALLSEPDDTVEYVVEGRISRGSLNLLAGKPKAGKSTLARHLAACIASGKRWLGHACIAGPVWYLVLEDKRSEVRKHFQQLGASGHIRFVFGNSPDLLAKLATLAEQERPICIVVDTLQRLVNAKDLNDYAEVTRRLEPVLALARASGAAVILVHHAGKGDRAGIDTILGSTALAGSVDNILLLNRTERYRVLSSIQRIGQDMPETVLRLDADGHLQTAGTRDEADHEYVAEQLFDALRNAAGWLTQIDWLATVEARRKTKLKAFALLRERGLVTEDGAGTKNDPRRYSIAVGGSGSRVPHKGGEPESSSLLRIVSSRDSTLNSGSRVPTVPQVPSDPHGTSIAEVSHGDGYRF
jgi:putative DNA primase/helicase